MTISEFLPIMAYLATGTGSPAPTREQTEVYYDLLRDLDAVLLQSAVKQVVLNHKYPNLPPVGTIRAMVLDLKNPAIPGYEAWELFVTAMRKHGYGTSTTYRAGHEPELIDHERRGLDSLPPRVRQAAKAFGWRTLCETTAHDMGIARTQFLKLYDSLVSFEGQKEIMPPDVKRLAEHLGNQFALSEAT